MQGCNSWTAPAPRGQTFIVFFNLHPLGWLSIAFLGGFFYVKITWNNMRRGYGCFNIPPLPLCIAVVSMSIYSIFFFRFCHNGTVLWWIVENSTPEGVFRRRIRPWTFGWKLHCLTSILQRVNCNLDGIKKRGLLWLGNSPFVITKTAPHGHNFRHKYRTPRRVFPKGGESSKGKTRIRPSHSEQISKQNHYFENVSIPLEGWNGWFEKVRFIPLAN